MKKLILEPGQIYTAKDFPRGMIRSLTVPGADAYVPAAKISKQIDTDPEYLRKYLVSTGGWEIKHLADHQENLIKLAWLAACEIRQRGEFFYTQV